MATLGAARRMKIIFLGMLIMHGGEFLATRDSSRYRDWPKSNAKKTRRRERYTFSSFLFAALHDTARRSLQFSPCNDKQYSLSFLKHGAARRSVWWGRTYTLWFGEHTQRAQCTFSRTCAKFTFSPLNDVTSTQQMPDTALKSASNLD